MGSFNGVLFDDSVWEILKDNKGNPHIHLKSDAVPENGDIRNLDVPPFGNFRYIFKDLPITRGPKTFPSGSNVNGQKIAVDVSYAFSGCDQLVEGSSVPNTVEHQDGEYEGCKSLKDAKNISEQCTSMSAYAANCSSLESIARIPDATKNAESALEGCISLTEFSGGKNIENAKCMCAGCSSMRVISPELNPNAIMDDLAIGTQIDMMAIVAEKDKEDKKKTRDAIRMSLDREAMSLAQDSEDYNIDDPALAVPGTV